MLYECLRQLLFTLPPEISHHAALSSMDWSSRLHLNKLMFPSVMDLPVSCLGLDFKNPVGLAAGLDKNGDHIDALADLGFGFVEIGTVTPKPQEGNPKPRLFRLKDQYAIINRMGFNNKGVDHLVKQVQKARFEGPLGINIGKNLTTPVEKALDDYRICLQKVYNHASYIVVNVSSPNTPGLRTLQYGDALAELLSGIKETHQQLHTENRQYVPLVMKIAPDLNQQEVETIASQLIEFEIDGVIATNTTASRVGVEANSLSSEQGGLSGKPLLQQSNLVIKQLSDALDGKMPIIGVGGITQGQDAAGKIKAGASLVQVYTGFIYRGPGLISESVDCIASEK